MVFNLCFDVSFRIQKHSDSLIGGVFGDRNFNRLIPLKTNHL